MQTEEKKLKLKINCLIDKIKGSEEELQQKNSYIEWLKESIKNLNAESFLEVQDSGEKEGTIFEVIKDFCLIARMIIREDKFIKYNYETKNSALYYKVQQEVFEDYICRYADADLKTFINHCIDLGLVKAEPSRKCVYTSGEYRIYYVNRQFMDATIKELEMQEA